MNKDIEALIEGANLPQPLLDVIKIMDTAFTKLKLELDDVNVNKSFNNQHNLITIRITDLESNKIAYLLINDKDKCISFGGVRSEFSGRVSYKEEASILFGTASAFAAKDYIRACAETDELKRAKYKTTRFITAKKYEGMTHDTLLEGLEEVFEMVAKVKDTNEFGIRLEPTDSKVELLIEYVPSTHTLLVDGAYDMGIKALIRVKVIERDQKLQAIFN